MTPENEYFESQVLTAPPYRLHLMLLDAAIRQARRGAEALERRDWESAHFALNSSRDCVNELLTGLDPAQAPELVDRLRALFRFVHRRLIMADFRHDPLLVRDAMTILEKHREAWLELIERLRTVPTDVRYEAGSMSWTT